MLNANESKNWLKRTIVDVTVSFEVPTVYCPDQAFENCSSLRCVKSPRFLAIWGYMGQDSCCVVADLHIFLVKTFKYRQFWESVQTIHVPQFHHLVIPKARRRGQWTFGSSTEAEALSLLLHCPTDPSCCGAVLLSHRKPSHIEDISWVHTKTCQNDRTVEKKLTLQQSRKAFIPPLSRNLRQFSGVSSVTFHMEDHAISITSSHEFSDSRILIRFNMIYKRNTVLSKHMHRKCTGRFVPQWLQAAQEAFCGNLQLDKQKHWSKRHTFGERRSFLCSLSCFLLPRRAVKFSRSFRNRKAEKQEGK